MDLILEGLKKELQTANSEDQEQFFHLVNTSMEVLKLSVADTAELIGVSCPTVRRWMAKESSPHPIIVPSVYKAFIKEIEGR